jgi:hypothetical protein
MAAARERLGKHVSAATDTHATMEVLLEKVFFTRSMPRCYNRNGLESNAQLIGGEEKTRRVV